MLFAPLSSRQVGIVNERIFLRQFSAQNAKRSFVVGGMNEPFEAAKESAESTAQIALTPLQFFFANFG